MFRLINALVSLPAVSSTRNSAELVGNFVSFWAGGVGDACQEEREEEDFISSIVSCCREKGLWVWSVYLYVAESACSFLTVVYCGVLIKNSTT
jgi:hypothetical protein